jgi:hypothetical protein
MAETENPSVSAVGILVYAMHKEVAMSQPATEWPIAQPVMPLEQRIQQLESALAGLHDLQAMEERIAERIAQQLQTAVSAEAQRLLAAQRQTAAPAAALPIPDAGGQVPSGPRNDNPSPRAASPLVGPMLAGLPSLLLDVCRDLLAIFWMFVDLRYAVAWPTRVLTVIVLVAILTSSWWDPLAYLWLVGPWLDKLVDLVLAFVMFKALSRETRRYSDEVKRKK